MTKRYLLSIGACIGFFVFGSFYFPKFITKQFFSSQKTSCQSKLFDSDDIGVIQNHLSSQANRPLVIFDIDNTLIRAHEVAARDECFSALLQAELSTGLNVTAACEKILPNYFEAMKKTLVSAIDIKSVDLIKSLQERGIVAIALTARSPYVLEECTLRQLNSVGIDFRHTSPSHEKALNLGGAIGKADFKGGVVFCGNNDKGEVLERLFNQTNFHPDQIIFIDDKEKNLTAVQREAKKLNIPFVGIRYSKLDAEIQDFSLAQLKQDTTVLVPQAA